MEEQPGRRDMTQDKGGVCIEVTLGYPDVLDKVSRRRTEAHKRRLVMQ